MIVLNEASSYGVRRGRVHAPTVTNVWPLTDGSYPCLPRAGKSWQPRKAGLYSAWLLVLLAALGAVSTPAWGATTLKLQTAAGGVTISGAHPTFSASLGNVNGLGVGTPSAGVTLITAGVSGGALYTTPYNLNISGAPGGSTTSVTAYVSSNFAHPAILILESCPINTSCTTASSFSILSTNAGAPTTVIPTPGVGNNTTNTATLGLFVANTNGAGTFSGSDSAIITFKATNSGGQTDTVTLGLNNETVQTAVRLLLATAPGGLTISPASDFSMNYGNVNGLGIGPAAGLTIVSASGGVIYSTPYLIKPSFSSFSSTTGSVKVYVSVDFVHPAILELRDAAASGGPYTAISKSSGAQSSLTTTAASGSSLTRYLGLFVSNVNGPTAFTGSDSATLTYTLTVP